MLRVFKGVDNFFDRQNLFLKEQFVDSSILAYLGDNLTKWLETLLATYGAVSSPVIAGYAHPSSYISGAVYIAPGATVEPTAMISGPCFIGPKSQVRHGAYIRGSVYIGRDAVVGHTTEVKGSVFLDEAKAGHFAYVGDSLLGRNVNLGAGTKLANLKFKGDKVSILEPKTKTPVATGLRKLGAIIGDNSQTGCNAVLSPGTLLMPGTMVAPCFHYLGTLESGIARPPR